MPKKYRKKIKPKVAFELWLKAGGRCQFPGCNKVLWRNNITMASLNEANIAHINSYNKANRWDDTLTEEEKNNISNLMLMCYDDHKMIDNSEMEIKYSVSVLKEYKANHEKRIEMLTSLNPEVKSHVVFFGSKVGNKNPFLDFKTAINAMLPDFYPANSYPVSIGISGGGILDSNEMYWKFEEESLMSKFQQSIEPLINSSQWKHISLFALAPQPLLIKLGSLLTEVNNVEVFQKCRKTQDWKWKKKGLSIFKGHSLIEPEHFSNIIALNLSLSANISDERITNTLGNDVSIWKITHESPVNTYMSSKDILEDFKNVLRQAIDRIKLVHGKDKVINVFPATPVSAAISVGLTRMPKADLPLVIYEQNHDYSGFYKTITIK